MFAEDAVFRGFAIAVNGVAGRAVNAGLPLSWLPQSGDDYAIGGDGTGAAGTIAPQPLCGRFISRCEPSRCQTSRLSSDRTVHPESSLIGAVLVAKRNSNW